MSCIAVTAIVVAWIAFGGNDSGDGGRAGTVTPASSSGNAHPLKQSGLAVGVIDGQPTAGRATKVVADQVSVRCHGSGDDLVVDVTMAGGWQITLTHGAQTVTVANPDLGYATAELTTAAGTRTVSQQLAKGTFPLGLTWDAPKVGDVEVQFSENVPAGWAVAGSDPEFLIFVHIRCGV